MHRSRTPREFAGFCAALACGLGFSLQAHAAPWFHVVDLGKTGSVTSATAINDKGSLVTNDDNHQAFLWSAAGKPKELPPAFQYGTSYARAVNARNVVVGDAWNPDLGCTHAVTWSKGVVHDLGTLASDPTAISRGMAINDKGVAVGVTVVDGDPVQLHAFLSGNGVMKDLGTLPGDTESGAAGINAAGHVVGYSVLAGAFNRRGFLYKNGRMIDLGKFGFANAVAINDQDVVAGQQIMAVPGGTTHALVYHAGTVTTLPFARPGDTAATAPGLNAQGDVVGASGTGLDQSVAYLYRAGVTTDLNTVVDDPSLMRLLSAESINDAGAVVGIGLAPDGTYHAFELIPLVH
jgi:probable HAF family extracellular repeat protein